MERWSVPDLLILADALAAAGLHTFAVGRALQRMERGEIIPVQAVQLIASKRLLTGCNNCHLIRQTVSDFVGTDRPVPTWKLPDR